MQPCSLTHDHYLPPHCALFPSSPRKNHGDDTQGDLRALRNAVSPFFYLFFFSFARHVRATHVTIAQGENQCDTRSFSTAHLLLDDKERILQRHSSIRSVFEFKTWAATAARHPRWKRVRASTARSSVERPRRSVVAPRNCASVRLVVARAVDAQQPRLRRPLVCSRSAWTDGVVKTRNLARETPLSHSHYRDVCSGSGLAHRYLFDSSSQTRAPHRGASWHNVARRSRFDGCCDIDSSRVYAAAEFISRISEYRCK